MFPNVGTVRVVGFDGPAYVWVIDSRDCRRYVRRSNLIFLPDEK